MLEKLLDYIFPRRQNLIIVRNLSEEEIFSLPRADSLDWIHPLFNYADKRVKAIIWELKYRGETSALDHIGKLLYDEILICMSEIFLFDKDAQFLLIPIPLSVSRKKERGYNQSEYIAKSILEYDIEHKLLYAPQWFQKVKETNSQSHSESKSERMENLQNCFFADPKVENKYVILI